jgi:hypothetical protein
MGDRLVKRHTPTRIVKLAQQLLALDASEASTTTIADATRKLSRRAKLELLSKLDSLLRGASRKSEKERVVAAKLFVSLLPDSLAHVEKWLGKTKDRWNYEFHFSLLCCLE